MSSFLFSGHYFLHSSLQSDFGCVELSQSRGRCEVWMNGFGLFGFSGTFSSLLYCRLTVCWIYCIFFCFVLFLRERWHLLQYCDDYLNCKLYRVHNCSPFSVGNPYKIVFSDHFFLFLVFFFCVFFFFPWLWKIKLYSSRVYPPPSALFVFIF